MGGISVGHSHPRPCSGEKTLRRCRNNEQADNVILIDGDSENFDNVIIIDIPESLPKKRSASILRKDKKFSFRNVIYIDDDETPDSNHSIDINNASFTAGTSSNRESCRAAKNFADSVDAADEECNFVQDNATPVRLSKCKRTYSGKAFSRNCYGLNTDSENDSSDDDYLDCELVEDSSGKVQELWEKAFFRRRKKFPNCHSDSRDHDSTSHIINEDHHQNIETNGATRQHKEASCSFGTGNFTSEDDVPFPFRTKDGNDFDCSRSFDVSVDGPNFQPGIFSSHIEQRAEQPASSNSAFKEQSTKEFNYPAPAFEDGETSEVEPWPSKFKPHIDENSCYGKSSPLEDEATICKSRSSFQTEFNSGRSFPGDCHKNFQETASDSVKEREHLESGERRATEGVKETVNLMPEGCSVKSSIFPDAQTNHSSTPSCGAVEDTLPSVETCLINEREKLKETDEYKRAIEEEWASRQQALLIQAEEAQRLRRMRKREKAENMRLLDMERRQKERVEEMRNVKKKDEENMNLKEIICTKVREDLKKLETTCHNMASLLHSLGICVGGWPNPSQQEVQIAYKRALLTFHPDRAPKSDFHQQVEAEEIFKLINRLKQKFPPF